MKKLYIGNLPYSVNDDKLREMFAQFGNIVSATVIMDRETNRSKGFGFVEFENDADADKAQKDMDGKEIEGRTLLREKTIAFK